MTAELEAENARLTHALHAKTCHPDFTYMATFGGSPVPPSGRWGTGWVPCPEVRGHGEGDPPRLTWWWRRLLEQDEKP